MGITQLIVYMCIGRKMIIRNQFDREKVESAKGAKKLQEQAKNKKESVTDRKKESTKRKLH